MFNLRAQIHAALDFSRSQIDWAGQITEDLSRGLLRLDRAEWATTLWSIAATNFYSFRIECRGPPKSSTYELSRLDAPSARGPLGSSNQDG